MDGLIGLGYTPNSDERKFSIILQLFENGVIPHKVFSQKYFTEQKGQLTIGEIPKYIVKDYTHYGRCSALDKIVDGKITEHSGVANTFEAFWENGLIKSV